MPTRTLSIIASCTLTSHINSELSGMMMIDWRSRTLVPSSTGSLSPLPRETLEYTTRPLPGEKISRLLICLIRFWRRSFATMYSFSFALTSKVELLRSASFAARTRSTSSSALARSCFSWILEVRSV